MIRKLRRKIVIVLMVILSFTVVVVMVAINMISQMNNGMEIQNRLKRIAANDGLPPIVGEDADPGQLSMGYLDNFTVQIDHYFRVRKIILSRDLDITEEQVLDYVNQVFTTQESYGDVGNYAYYVSSTGYGYVAVFMDVETYHQANRNLLLTTQLIGAATIMGLFLISLGLAFWLVKPVKETFDKQKLFISNASHELKTPLAVISANTEVLEGEIGDNKWVGYIRSETERMSELVNELLCLARLDDKSGHRMIMEEADLSALILQTVLPFESTVFEMGKSLDVEVIPDVKLKCDSSAIKHVVTILLDNAIKYSNEHGMISVKLYLHGSKKIIEVFNTGEGVPKDKLNKIFERFYRQDEARNSKSGGYGLGLAIAKASVEAHNGKIIAQSEYGKWMKFIVTL